jgi:hypothetical protein
MKNPVWWVIAILVLLMAGCTTPLITARGDFGPISYEFESVYTAPVRVDLDGFLVWDGWPFRADTPAESGYRDVDMPPGEE